MTAAEIDQLIRKVTEEVYHRNSVLLTGISVYSMNTGNPEAAATREKISGIIAEFPDVLQMHGFYLDQAEKTIRFDVVISFDAKDRGAVYREICERIREAFPDYNTQIIMDTDFSE